MSGSGCDGDACGIRGADEGGFVEEEGAVGFDGETGGTRLLHGLDGGKADDGDVEALVLIGFGDFDDGEGAGKGASLPCLDDAVAVCLFAFVGT